MTDDADTTAAPDPRPGIQPGQVAQRPESAHLHSSAQAVCQEVFQEEAPRHLGLQWQRGLSSDEIYGLAGLLPEPDRSLWGTQPDGGIFFWTDARGRRTPLLAVEAKNQQNAGNAIERWFKNHAVLTSFGPGFRYITFCSGEGAAPGGCISRVLDLAFVGHAVAARETRIRRWNVLYSSGPSMFRRVQGFPPSWMRTVVGAGLRAALAEVRRR
jgi:hypothetical protein